MNHFNAYTGFCRRASLYRQLDTNKTLHAQTGFFGATADVSTALANVTMPGAGLFFSKETVNFLNDIGVSLMTINLRYAVQIDDGHFFGDVDHAMVINEQTHVKAMLDDLKASNQESYNKVIEEVNHAMNSAASTISGLFVDVDYNMVLSDVKKALGHDINFADINDRIAIGNEMINSERRKQRLKPDNCPAEVGICQ